VTGQEGENCWWASIDQEVMSKKKKKKPTVFGIKGRHDQRGKIEAAGTYLKI